MTKKHSSLAVDVLDDEEGVRNPITGALSIRGVLTRGCSDIATLISGFGTRVPDLIFLDFKLASGEWRSRHCQAYYSSKRNGRQLPIAASVRALIASRFATGA